jgi:hypothetical protein
MSLPWDMFLRTLFSMLNKFPEFDYYYVAYLKDDPAQGTYCRELLRAWSSGGSSTQDRKGESRF